MVRDNTFWNNIGVDNYKREAIQMIKLVMPQLPIHQIEEAVDWSILNNSKDHPAIIYNNYKERTYQTTIYDLTQYLLSRRPIMTSYGVLFQQYEVIPNPLAAQVDGYITERGRLKKEMFKYPKGSEMFEKYNLAQMLKKIQANSK